MTTYNHLKVIKNRNGETGKWSEEKKAWVIAVSDPSDPDEIESDMKNLMEIVGFKLGVKWWSPLAPHAHACACADHACTYVRVTETPRAHTWTTLLFMNGPNACGMKEQNRTERRNADAPSCTTELIAERAHDHEWSSFLPGAARAILYTWRLEQRHMHGLIRSVYNIRERMCKSKEFGGVWGGWPPH